MKKTLVVGGGAVGQVYGWALNRAGFEVSFYLKQKHKEEAKAGYTLYWLNRDRDKKCPIELKNFRVLTTPQEVASEQWDQIYVTVSSTALRQGWLKDFAPATSQARIIVMLQAGLEDRKYLLNYISETKLISGVISMIAYAAPLPDSHEKVAKPGNAFYFPPFSTSMISGPKELVRETALALSAGGIRSKYTDTPASQVIAFPNALLITLITALEGLNWSIARLRERSQLDLLSRALHEAVAIVSREFLIPIPFVFKLISPFTLRFFINAAPQVLPFEVEPYLKAHFSKVHDQTRMMMKDYLALGIKYGLPTQSLQSLEIRATIY